MRGLPPLPSKVAKVTDDLAVIPPGYGFLPTRVADLKSYGVMGQFEMYEPPLRGYAYVVSADIADGLGLDRSSLDVIRLPTVERPAEQVGHYLSDRIQPREAAFILDALGHLYCDDDGLEALCAIECNNHGLSTQDILKLHLGYRHLYRRENLDASTTKHRFLPRDGWLTTPRTRPLLLSTLYGALTTVDALSGETDLQLNSAHTIGELQDFQTDTTLAEAAASSGAHDDCLMSVAIGYYVASTVAAGEREPIAERRRRLRHIEARRKRLHETEQTDYRNSAYTQDEAQHYLGRDPLDPEIEEAIHDIRGVYYEY